MSKDIAAIIDSLAKPLEIDLYEVKYKCLTKEEGAPHNLQGFTCTSYYFKNQDDACDYAYQLYCQYVNETLKLNCERNAQINNMIKSKNGFYHIAGKGGGYHKADLLIRVEYRRFYLNTSGMSSMTQYMIL